MYARANFIGPVVDALPMDSGSWIVEARPSLTKSLLPLPWHLCDELGGALPSRRSVWNVCFRHAFVPCGLRFLSVAI